MGSRWWRREGSSEVTVRISHQRRAWFNGPWHFGLRAWSGAVLVLGGSSRDAGGVYGGGGVEGAGLGLVPRGAGGGGRSWRRARPARGPRRRGRRGRQQDLR